MDYDSNRAPAVVGQSNHVKAIDETAKIVMETYGMTDLRTDVREGETMAPKLAPKLQAMADGMFGGGRNRGIAASGMDPARLARQAMGGAFSPKRTGSADPISVVQAPREKPPVQILNARNQGR